MRFPLVTTAAILFASAALGAPGCVTIASITPPSGTAGTHVVITGSGFASCCPFECPEPGVTFGGAPAQVVSWGDTRLVVIAPGGPGPVDVTVLQISATATVANGFTFLPSGVPALGPIAMAAVALLLIGFALVRLR